MTLVLFFGFDLLFGLRLALAHPHAIRQNFGLSQMLWKFFSQLVRVLRIARKLVRYGRVIGLALIVSHIWNVMHEGGFLDCLLISLIVIGETRKVLFELVFEGAILIDLKVRFVLYVQHVLSGFYIVPMIGQWNTNIYVECSLICVLGMDCALGSPSL